MTKRKTDAEKAATAAEKAATTGAVKKAPEAKAPEAKAPEAKAPEAKAPEAKAPEAKAPEAKKAKKSGFVVAPGKAITSKKGILASGVEVKPEYIGSQDSFDALVKKKVLVKA